MPSMRRPWRLATAAALATTLVVTAAPTASAERWQRHPAAEQRSNRAFQHTATFDVRTNGSEVAEIVEGTADGKTLFYTDSATGQVGIVDISDPAAPTPAGVITVGGSPTSVGITKTHALVATDTSDGDFDRPTGELVVIDVHTRSVVKVLPLGGQPDSVAISPDGRYAAVVLENQRDEDENDGVLPQLPSGQLVVLDLKGDPDWWPMRYVDFAGLDMAHRGDAEPEFVDINRRNQAVVSLQENNHLAIVDLRTGTIVNDFSAGEVTIEDIDATEDALGPQENGIISLTESINRRREPDTVGWITNDTFAAANEGDYTDADGVEGGSRSFTIFNADGEVDYEARATFEHASIRAGHYNENRSANKGGEPEGLEVGEFGGKNLLFVGSERANVIGVYDVGHGEPELLQLLPSGIGPEGLKAIPSRDLFVSASETSVDDDIPSMITIYSWEKGEAAYPQIVSGDDDGELPIGWVALSGLAGDATEPRTLYAVNDSFLADAGIFTIEASTQPATITDRVVVADPDGSVRRDLDLEGIAVAPEGGFWLASEGRIAEGSSRPNLLLKVDEAGGVQFEVPLPAELLEAGLTSSGFEGVAVTGGSTSEFVYAVIQREWASDARGSTKIGRYEVATGEWTFASYALDAVESPAGGWVGLSELTLTPEGTFTAIERDNRSGTAARIKRIYEVDLASVDFQPFAAGTSLPVVPKTLLVDLLPGLAENSVWTAEKVEGFGIDADGRAFVVTDNDGVDDAIGQTVFLDLGPFAELG